MKTQAIISPYIKFRIQFFYSSGNSCLIPTKLHVKCTQKKKKQNRTVRL